MSTPKSPKVKTKRAYIGGFVDVELRNEIQKIADVEARGNKTHILEKFLRMGVAHLRSQEAALV